MLDGRAVVQDPQAIKEMLRRRRADDAVVASVDRLVEVNARRRAVQTEGDELKARRNTLSKEVGQWMRQGKADEAEPLKAEVRAIADRLEGLDAELATLEAEERDVLLRLPNTIDPRVPAGASDADNEEVRRWGTPRTFDFAPRWHDDIATALGILDNTRAAKLSGARFSVLRGAGAALERALVAFFLDRAVREHGYTEVSVPFIVSRGTMVGTGQLPKFEDDLFRLTAQVDGQDAFLIPTAEVPVTNLHADEILEEAALPIRYAAFTPCFRSEAGSYGKDTRGIIRQHQFLKVELVKITTPEQSDLEHEALTGNAEKLLQELGLPYRTVRLCSGDLGFGGRHTYDIEVWLPAQGAYREISSCTTFGDFQARRMGLRYRPADGGKPRPCHTINGSGLAVGRTLVAILENYQQADGSVVVPEVLRPWLGGLDRITRVA